jgi:hypothetical protein
MKTWGTLGNNGRWQRFDEGTSGTAELRTSSRWSEVASNVNWSRVKEASDQGMRDSKASQFVICFTEWRWTLLDHC